MEIEVNGKKFWVDEEMYKAALEFDKQLEEDFFNYIVSGKRTVDMFGKEGAKEVLRKQAKRDLKDRYNHRSHGRLGR